MPRHAAFQIKADWVLVTSESVVSLTVQNRGSADMEISPYAGSRRAAPQGLVVPPRTALVNRRVSDLFPGYVAAGATSDVYARAVSHPTWVFVSHV